MNLNILNEFRHGLYGTFFKAADALFELTDALATETQARSLPELSLSPFFSRQWPSLYQALQEGELNRPELRHLLATFVPAPPPGERLLLGVDASNIARPESPTAADRTCLHVHNLPEGAAAITYGWQFSTVVVLPSRPGSQTYILDNQRIASSQTASQVAVSQLEQLVPLLPAHYEPLLTADRYYGSAAFVRLSEKVALDKLLRIKRNLVFYADPPAPTLDPQSGKIQRGRGAPRKDGARFKCNEPATQPPPDEAWEGMDEQGHSVEVARWKRLHFRTARHQSLSVLRVIRAGASDRPRDPRTSWFIYVGRQPLALAQVASSYRRRYSQEHGYRFDKQALLWAQPRLRTPRQFELWTALVSAVHDEVVLAQPLVEAVGLWRPWENVQRPLSLQQVRRGLNRIIRHLGTPARPPKGRGKSPGRAKGAVIKPAQRYEVVRKHSSRRKKVKKRG